MPEQPEKWPRGVPWRLMDAHNAGQTARISCGHCNIRRYFQPAELRQIVGNVTIDELRKKMRCEKCGLNEFLRADLFHPVAAEAMAIRYRRLVEIKFVRRIVWRDE
jgi:ribosomal protein S27AE